MPSTHVYTSQNTLKITDSFDDSATFQINDGGVYLVIEHRRAPRGTTLSIAITNESTLALRDALLKRFPLPKVEPAVTVSSVGELSSIEVTGGSVVINANGNVIVNNK